MCVCVFHCMFMTSEKPNPPECITVVSTNKGSITLSWKPSSNDGGSQITAYAVEVCLASDTNYVASGTVNGDVSQYEMTGLIDGSDYFVRVRAQNMAGLSEPLEFKDPIKARKTICKLS